MGSTPIPFRQEIAHLSSNGLAAKSFAVFNGCANETNAIAMEPLSENSKMRMLDSGFAELGFAYPDDLIHLFVGGSQLHGAKLEGTDDTDYYGVFVEPPEKVVGLDPYEHFVWSSSEHAHGPQDLDVCLYSLRKWARLAAKGNPSILHFLFAQPVYVCAPWDQVKLNLDVFLAKSHAAAFLGYANAQLQKLLGKKSRDTNRPHLERQFGYDTKYAMHILRLLEEGRELMESGHITLPRPNAAFLRDIRTGKYQLHEITEMANVLERELIAARDASLLPEHVDRAMISRTVGNMYRTYWNDKE